MLLFSLSGQAQAKKNTVSEAFNGKIIISKQALSAPDSANVKKAIKEYKAKSLQVIQSENQGGVSVWHFHFTAFLKSKPKSENLVLEFYTDDKEKLFVADKRLSGADPNLKIIASHLQINENENINKNRNYILKLITKKGKKEIILATTRIATK